MKGKKDMLKTNSKEFRNKLRNYIIDCFNFEQYLDDTGINLEHTFDAVKTAILESFNNEKYYSDSYAINHGIKPATMFNDWVCGLPLYFNVDDFVLGDAGEILGGLLNQSKSDRAKYSTMESMNLLIDLIYRELKR